MTDVLLLTNQRTAASQAPPPTPGAKTKKKKHGIKGERHGGLATRSWVQLFLEARGLFVWSLHVLPVPMWDSKLTLGVFGCLFLYVSPVMSPRNYRIRDTRVRRQRKRTTKARESLKWLKTDRACVRLPGFRQGCCMFYFRTSGSRQPQPVCSE